MHLWSSGRRVRITLRRLTAWGLLAVMLLAASAAYAQRSRYGRYGRFAVLEDFDGSFQFCRVMFRGIQGGDGGDWQVDYPRADENLSIRLSELTKTPVS